MNITYSLTTGKITLATDFSHAEFDPDVPEERLRLCRLIRITAEREAGFYPGRGGVDSAKASLAYDLARIRRFDEAGRKSLRLEDLED